VKHSKIRADVEISKIFRAGYVGCAGVGQTNVQAYFNSKAYMDE